MLHAPMAQDRIAVLKTLAEQNPADAFARYGLALEYVKSGALSDAMAEFRTLLEHNPDYAAGYFHGAQTLEKLGDVAGARELYRRGIEVTTRTGDLHTRSELQGALDLLG
jgi:Tfp pilus assembly protein PilF